MSARRIFCEPTAPSVLWVELEDKHVYRMWADGSVHTIPASFSADHYVENGQLKFVRWAQYIIHEDPEASDLLS